MSNDGRTKTPRPIRRDHPKRDPMPRIPWDGPLTPSLRRKELAQAIGFRLPERREWADEDA